MNPKTAEELLEMAVRSFLVRELKSAISDEYLYDICRAIRDEVLLDVKETSAWSKNKTWNNDDIKLSVGRVLMRKLGLEC